MEDVCIAFCESLKAIRAASGLGQIAFSKKLGLSQPVYARYEKGDREPSLNTLCRIARSLGTTPNEILGFDPLPMIGPAKISTGDNSPIAIGNNITQTIARPARKTRKPKPLHS